MSFSKISITDSLKSYKLKRIPFILIVVYIYVKDFYAVILGYNIVEHFFVNDRFILLNVQ